MILFGLLILIVCGALIAAGVGIVWVMCAVFGWVFNAKLAVTIACFSLLIGGLSTTWGE